MEITPLRVGSLTTNCYLVSSNDRCAIIDPGDDADFISSTIIEKKLKPQSILLTHGHFDHCLACLELKLNFNIPILLHPSDFSLYKRSSSSATHWTGIKSFRLPNPEPFPKDEIALGDEAFKIIPTPGHTPGSICLKNGNSLFTGDTLFAEGVGRTDYAYSSQPLLKESLKKIMQLSPDTVIYPGHEDYGFTLSTIIPSVAQYAL